MKRILLYIAMAGLCLPAMAQITGGGNSSQPTPKTPEKASITDGSVKGSVNLFNGLYQSSQALGTVTTPTGLSYTLTMSYQSTVVTGDNAPFTTGIPYGEGWNLDIPSITVNLAALHKFTRDQRENNTSTSTTQYPFTTAQEAGDEGALQWFSPMLNIPGVASGRLVFKAIDTKLNIGVEKAVFVLHEFDTYIEAAFDGKYWIVTLPDGTIYAFEQIMYDVINPNNQRMTLDDGNSGTPPNLIGYGSQREAQKGASRWLVTSIFKPSKHLYNRIHFTYKELGKFNFNKESLPKFSEALQRVTADTDAVYLTTAAKDVLLQSVTAEYFRDRNINVTEATAYLPNVVYEKLDLVYEEDTTLAAGKGDILSSNKAGVTSFDDLYNKKTVYKIGQYEFGINFTNWHRYHAWRQGTLPSEKDANVLAHNPYLKTDVLTYYNREKISSSGDVPMNHNFCESPLIKWQNIPGAYDDFKPGGELYELKTTVYGGGKYCNIDINIVAGSGEDLGSTGTVYEGDYKQYRANTLYTTFGNMRKWNTLYHSGGLLKTSNFFVMPHMQSVTSGFYLQVGPGNSDNDFSVPGQTLSDATAVGSGSNPNWRVLNSYYSDPAFVGAHNIYYNNHTYKIPYNFGGGWPWAAGANMWTGEGLTLFRTWPFWGAMAGDPDYKEGATLAEGMELDNVELVRYSKKPLVLRKVNYYVMNGKIDGSKQQTGTGFLKLVSSREFTYTIQDLKTYPSVLFKNSYTRSPGYNRHAIMLATITNKGASAIVNVTKLAYTLNAAPKAKLFITKSGSDSIFAYNGGAEFMILTSVTDHLGKESRIEYYPLENDGSVPSISPNAAVDLGTVKYQYTPDWEQFDPYSYAINPGSLVVAGPQITRMYYMVVKNIKTYTDASYFTTVSYTYASGGVNNTTMQRSKVYFPLDNSNIADEPTRKHDVFKGNESTLGFDLTTETQTNTIGGSSVTLTTKYYHYGDATGTNPSKEIYENGHLFGKLYKTEVYNNSNVLQKSTEITYEITKAYKNGYKRRGDAQYKWDYADFQTTVDTSKYSYRNVADTSYGVAKSTRNLLAFYDTRSSFAPFLEGIYYNKIDSVHPDYLHSFFIKKSKEVSKVYQSGKTMTNTTEYAYYEADYQGNSPTVGFKYILDNLALGSSFAIKYEPSWQIYSVKKYSDELKSVTEKTEYFYYYDLIQKHNVFQNINGSPLTLPTGMLNKKIYPRMHPFIEQGLQGLGMCQYFAVRDVPFEVRTTKEAPGQNTHRQSSYFLLDRYNEYNQLTSWYKDSTVAGTISGTGTPPVILPLPCENQGAMNPNVKTARAAAFTNGLTESPTFSNFTMFETPLYHLPIDQHLFPPGRMDYDIVDQAGKELISSTFNAGDWIKVVFNQVLNDVNEGTLVSLTPTTGAGSKGGNPCAKVAQMLNIPKRSISGYVTPSITDANMANVTVLTDFAYAGINTMYYLAMAYNLDPDSFVNAQSATTVMQIMTDINHGRKPIGSYITTITFDSVGGYTPQYDYRDHYITISEVLVQIDSLVLGDFNSWVGITNVDYPILHFKDTVGDPLNTYHRNFRPLLPYNVLKTKDVLALNQFGQVKSESDAIGVVNSFDVNTTYTVYAFMSGKNYNGLTVNAVQVGLPITTRNGITGDLSKYTKSCQYSDLNQLTRITDENNVQANFEYDGTNRLLRKKLNTQTIEEYTYHSWNQDGGYTTQDQKATQNYVQARKYIGNPVDGNYLDTRSYLDPLARAYQTVTMPKVSGDGSDSVLYSGKINYDAWNRTTRSYEPFIKYASSLNTDFTLPAGTLADTTLYENDAFSRVLESTGLGDVIAASGTHNIKNTYSIIDGATLVTDLGLTTPERDELMPQYSVGGVTYLFNVTATNDQDGKRTLAYTDALGRQVASKAYTSNTVDETKKVVTLFFYDSKGLQRKVSNPKKQIATYNYNIMGWLVSKTTVDNGTMYYMYNQGGNVVLEQDSMGKSLTTKYYRRYVYDDYGRMIRQERPDRLSGATAGTAPFEARTGYLDDYSWTFVRNVSGTNRDYNYFMSNVKKEKEVFYDDKPISVPQYPCTNTFETDNALGKVATTVSYNNSGIAVLYQLFKYDADGRLAQEVQRFNKTQVGSVNGSGQIEDIYVRMIYSYGVQQELISRNVYLNIVKPPASGLDCPNIEKLVKQYYYTYDKWGRLSQVFYNDQDQRDGSGARLVASYVYDLATGLVKTRTNYTFLDYDYKGINTGNPVTYSYDSKNRLTQMGSSLFDWSLYYDANQPSGFGVLVTTSSNYNGNINGTLANYKIGSYSITGFSNTQAQTWYTYTYDGLNRLVKAYGNLQTSASTTSQADEGAVYDVIGNMLNLRRLGSGVFTGTYTYAGSTNRLSSVVDSNTSVTRSYIYTQNGALASDNFRKITMSPTTGAYGRANLPFTITKTVGPVVTNYLYNNKDVRISRITTAATEFYLIDELGSMLAVIDFATLTPKEWYIEGDAKTQFDGSNKEYPVFFLKDHLGNTRIAYSASNSGTKTIQNVYDYYPYGKLLRSYDLTAQQRFLTTGNERDIESGLDYRNARYSDADIGRFLSVDPLAGKTPSWNPYRYCFDNPINLIDPSGMSEGWYTEDGVLKFNSDVHDADDVARVIGSGDGKHREYINEEVYVHFSNGFRMYGDASGNMFMLIPELVIREQISEVYRDRLAALASSGLLLTASIPEKQESVASQIVHASLDGMGLVPGFGEAADGLNAVIYAMQGDMANAALSTAAMVPFAGWAATGGKWAIKGVDAANGGLNLFKFGKPTTTAAEGWQMGDRMLFLPNQGSPKLNWKQNSGYLRQEMGKGNPIFDSYRRSDGSQIQTGGFLRAERQLLESRGWQYNPMTGAYYPPIK